MENDDLQSDKEIFFVDFEKKKIEDKLLSIMTNLCNNVNERILLERKLKRIKSNWIYNYDEVFYDCENCVNPLSYATFWYQCIFEMENSRVCVEGYVSLYIDNESVSKEGKYRSITESGDLLKKLKDLQWENRKDTMEYVRRPQMNKFVFKYMTTPKPKSGSEFDWMRDDYYDCCTMKEVDPFVMVRQPKLGRYL